MLVNKKNPKTKSAQLSHTLLIIGLERELDQIFSYASFETLVLSEKIEACKGSPYKKNLTKETAP